MRHMTFGRLFRRLVFAAAGIGALVAWSTFLWPPIGYYLDHRPAVGPVYVFLQLLHPLKSDIYHEPLLGWAFLGVSALIVVFLLACLRSVGLYLERSTVGIAILRTKLVLTMEDQSGARAKLTRNQLFHANRTGIRAYHLASKAEAPTGAIDPNSVALQSVVAGQIITDEVIKRHNHKSVDVIETYIRDLPTNFFATYLPNLLVYWLYLGGLFRGTVVHRTGEVMYDHEYDGPTGIISITSARYPVTNVIVEVNFDEHRAPQPQDIRAFVISDHVVEKLAVMPVQLPGRKVYRVEVSRLYQESVRVQWTF